MMPTRTAAGRLAHALTTRVKSGGITVVSASFGVDMVCGEFELSVID